MTIPITNLNNQTPSMTEEKKKGAVYQWSEGKPNHGNYPTIVFFSYLAAQLFGSSAARRVLLAI